MVSILGPGDYFGELGLLFGTPRTATVRAATHCELIMLSKHNLDQVLVKFPIVRRYVSSYHHQHKYVHAVHALYIGVRICSHIPECVCTLLYTMCTVCSAQMLELTWIFASLQTTCDNHGEQESHESHMCCCSKGQLQRHAIPQTI